MTDTVHIGDARETLRDLVADASVDCCVTSPPYLGLRDYDHPDQIGRESTPGAYVRKLAAVFLEVQRVLKPTGSLFLVVADSYLKKDLVGIPWRLALTLQDLGWVLRSAVVWRKPNTLPQGARDRFTLDYEHVFQLVKEPKGYYFNGAAVAEPWTSSKPYDLQRIANGHKGYSAKHATKKTAGGIKGQPVGDPSKGRNRRSVWDISAPRFKGAHFATMPAELARLCIKAGCPPGGVVLDPFAGSGTVLQVARELGRSFVGIELNPAYEQLIRERLNEGANPQESDHAAAQ
jgi:DNA modification methylase